MRAEGLLLPAVPAGKDEERNISDVHVREEASDLDRRPPMDSTGSRREPDDLKPIASMAP